MPYSRPSLADLVQRTLADAVSRLATVADALRRADAQVFARVIAGATHGLFGFIDFVAKQLFPDSAEKEYLDRHASMWLQQPRKSAAKASGSYTFTTTVGAFAQAGTQLKALDGVLYQTTADATAVGVTTAVAIEAVVAGAAGNRAAGAPLSLVSPIPGIQTSGLAGALSGGADVEEDEDLRGRVLSRIKTPPHGGALHDYEAWALEVAGVTRAWPSAGEAEPNSVVVRFVRDNDVSIIPDAGELTTVFDYIDARRPVQAKLYVLAPIPDTLNFTIGVSPNTLAVKDAVIAELKDLLLREGQPGGTLLLSHIRAAISAAAGETNYTMSSPSADVVSAPGHMPVFGTITWV